MTHQDWVVTINKLIGKTREGKLEWTPTAAGGRCAKVGESHQVTLDYGVALISQEMRLRPGSLQLTLALASGEPLARVTEEELARDDPQVGLLALRQLFHTVVVQPREGMVDRFRSALEEI
ncbi:MAG: hypothetical protein HYU66_11980 [Armatimonadetes bacterium]|nr:hypothetical protein [Armatimonadota bacterium]